MREQDGPLPGREGPDAGTDAAGQAGEFLDAPVVAPGDDDEDRAEAWLKAHGDLPAD